MTAPRDPAPGRYCLARCYCGECDHYVPMPQPDADTGRLADVIYLPEPRAT